MMRLTKVVINQGGNIWALNNWKPDFDIDVCCNPGSDGMVIFIGLAPAACFTKIAERHGERGSFASNSRIKSEIAASRFGCASELKKRFDLDSIWQRDMFI